MPSFDTNYADANVASRKKSGLAMPYNRLFKKVVAQRIESCDFILFLNQE